MLHTVRYLLIVLCSVLAVSDSFSQWTNIAPGLLGIIGSSAAGGRIIYKDGLIWAGKKDVWMSADMGKTWSKRSPVLAVGSDVVMDIMFLDAMVGIVVVFDGVYLTKNQGMTWQFLKPTGLSGSLNSGSFSGSPDNIILTSNSGDVMVSNNGGLTWVSKIRRGCAFNVLAGNDASVYVLAGDGSGGSMYISHDYGNTWRQTSGTYDWDCFSLARDKCDTGTFYIANEDVIAPTDGLSCVFRSTNSGETWTMHNPKSLPYHCGSVSSVEGAVFVQTYKGIDRSTDKGLTWRSINGPSLQLDTRCVAAVSKNIIISTDNVDGSIYMTHNSGGDSLPDPAGAKPIEFTPKVLFSGDTVCYDTVNILKIIRSSCNAASIADITIEGVDSASYRIKSMHYDLLEVEFLPIGTGQKNARMIIKSSNGSIDTIELKGFSKNEPFTYTATPNTLFENDTLWMCEENTRTMHITLSSCILPLVVSERIIGVHADDYAILNPLPIQSSIDQDVSILFKATSTGFRSATYELTLSNGTTISVPLKGYTKPSLPLSFITSDKSTDTIGGTVQIPISLNGLDDKREVELVLHYDEGLDYEGSFSTTGSRLDVAGEQWKGRSKLFIPNAVSGSPLGYSHFTVFADSGILPKITFDSLVVLDPASPCEFILPSPVISTITPPSGCGIQILSDFVRYGYIGDIDVFPNPATQQIFISTDRDISSGSLEIFDMYGVKHHQNHCDLKAKSLKNIDVSDLSSGTYILLIRTETGTQKTTFIINR